MIDPTYYGVLKDVVKKTVNKRFQEFYLLNEPEIVFWRQYHFHKLNRVLNENI